MSTAELKNYLVKQIIDIEDENLLEKVKSYVSSLRKEKSADWWDDLSQEEKDALDEGIAQADRGELIPHDEVMKEIKAKYNLKQVALTITWTSRAKFDYHNILQYLQRNWTKKELQKFIDKTAKTISIIADKPELFPATKRRNSRRCVLSKQTSLYYRVKKKEIELLMFWDNRQNPKTLKF